MGLLKQDFPDVPLIALTATANQRVKKDVMACLRMQSPVVLTASFNRKNLRYEVRSKPKNVLGEMAKFIKTKYPGKCGIIYCSSKKKCEDTADKLRRDFHIPAKHYHAVSTSRQL
jgi:superfamily II DNA helicase RecQ